MNRRASTDVSAAATAPARRGQGTLLRRFYLLRKIASFLLPEYRFKWPQMAWWDDATFNAYVESSTNSTATFRTAATW